MSVAVAAPELVANRDFFEKVSLTIGGEISPARVADVIDGSEEMGLIFHGIKSRAKARRAFSEGIKPLTPEGGKASWWAHGKHLFSHPEQLNGWFGVDSPFFGYAHWKDKAFGVSGMTLAVTSRDGLEEDYIEHGGQGQVVAPIPADVIQFLSVEVVTAGLYVDFGREIGIAKEIRMFELLEEVVERGPIYGTVVQSLARV